MRRPLLVLLFLFLAVPLGLAAQTGGIRGHVTDSLGTGLSGATVAVDGGRAVTTGSGGAYELGELPPGIYTVRARLIGYTERTARVIVAAGRTMTHEFRLSRSVVQVAGVNVVVGSRARHTAAEELAVPVDVYTSETIAQQPTTETSQILQELSPSVNFPRQSVTDADDIVRPFTLRGLSPDHTLVLVNGLRRHRTALVHIFAYGMGAGSSGVDLNALPASAIDRIEVLRDGAAAQYGSDAIAGVVNVVLKEGPIRPFLTTEAGRYVTGQGYKDDGNTVTAGGGLGVKLGRGSVALFGEYRHRDPTNRAGGDNSDQLVPGDADVVDTITGAIISKNNPVAMPNHHWGDGLAKDALGFLNASYPLSASGNAELYAFGGYSYRNGQGEGFYRQGLSDRNWPQIYPQGYLPTFDGKVRDGSAAAGVRGAAAGWSYDVGGSFGHNSFRYDLLNTMNVSLGPCLDVACAPGLDGVMGTADDPGIPNKTSIYAGTLSLNELATTADIAKPFAVGLPAPLNVALGVAYRRENYRIAAGEPASYIQGGHPNQYGDPAPPGSQVFAGFQPANETDHSRGNVGTYLDLETNLAPSFLVNVAGRFEHYSDFGSKLTEKLALRFQAARQLVLRGALSTGFRAPSLSQSFYGSKITNFELDTVTNRQRPVDTGIFPVDHPAAIALGAKPLKPETSVNASAGFAVTPVPSLTLTADYYYIRIKDRIILTALISGPEIQQRLVAAGQTSIEGAQYFTNALTTRTQGVDVTASYRIGLGGTRRIDLSGVYNYTKNKVLAVNEPPELAGTGAVLFDSVASGGLISLERERPDQRFSLTGTYATDRFHLLARTSYWGKYTSAQIGACADCVQTYGAKTLVDAEVGYRFQDVVELSLGARNLFDTYPDRPSYSNSFGIMVWPAASPFGYNGRYLYTRAEIALGR